MRFFLMLSIVLGIAYSAQAKMAVRTKTTMIVIHHSATVQGSVETFRQYHINHNKWEDIGYHYVITNGRGGPDGGILVGRPEQFKGAHAANSGPNRNAVSVGICLVGTEEFTPKQRAALVAKLVELCRKYDIIPTARTIQPHHRDCPGKGLDVAGVIAQVADELKK